MERTVSEYFNESIQMVERYGKCLLEDPRCDIKSKFEELSPVLIQLYGLRNRHLAAETTFDDFMNEIESSEELDVDNIVERFKCETEKAISTAPSGETNESYIEFKNSFFKDNPCNDSDIATVSEAISTIDPILKLPLVDPVKNKICGHVYEKRSILILLGEQKIVKCPVAGCNASERVRRDHLVPDLEMKKYLDQKNS